MAGHRLDIAFGMIPLGDARRMAGTLLPAKVLFHITSRADYNFQSIYYTHKKFKNPAEFPDTIPVMAAFFSVDAAYSKRFSNLPADAKKKKPVATAPQTSKAPQ